MEGVTFGSVGGKGIGVFCPATRRSSPSIGYLPRIAARGDGPSLPSEYSDGLGKGGKECGGSRPSLAVAPDETRFAHAWRDAFFFLVAC